MDIREVKGYEELVKLIRELKLLRFKVDESEKQIVIEKRSRGLNE